MLIKEEVRKSCPSCGRFKEVISEAVYGCDCCRKPIAYIGKANLRHHDFLELLLFRNEGDPIRKHLCSWKCVMKELKKMKKTQKNTNHFFLSLPNIILDADVVPEQSLSSFLKYVKIR